MDQSTKETYIRRCFRIAQRSWRTTHSNPIVGAVLVHNGRIIGEGYHQKFGEAHAEVNCLNSVAESDKQLISESDLFISLEPCSFIGKTPACSSLITQYKIPRVYIASIDPNPKVSKNGILALEQSGIHVEYGILQEEGDILLRKFKVNILKKRPFIALKWAQSAFGYSGLENSSVWYTNPISKIKAHFLRAQFDAILVGTNTVIHDDPQLNNRYAPGIDPVRIVIDIHERIPKTAKIFSKDQFTYIITSKQNYNIPENQENEIILINTEIINWHEILSVLFEKGISSILIEGGSHTHKSFVQERLWDEAHILSSKHPQNHGLRAPTLVGKRLESVSLGADRYDHMLPMHEY